MILSYPDELIKKGSGNLIGLSHFGHFAIDTLRAPSEFDDFDTVELSVGATQRNRSTRLANGLRDQERELRPLGRWWKDECLLIA